MPRLRRSRCLSCDRAGCCMQGSKGWSGCRDYFRVAIYYSIECIESRLEVFSLLRCDMQMGFRGVLEKSGP